MSEWKRNGKYIERDGPAYSPGGAHCEHKLCFATTDRDALVALMKELGAREDCFYAKYSAEPHAGMFLGRVFLTDPYAVGALWQDYKQRAPFYCSVQDDTFTLRFRPLELLLRAALEARRTARLEEGPRPDAGSDVDAVNVFVLMLGGQSEPAWWERIEPEVARDVLTALFHRDLAYRAEMLPAPRARLAAERFVAHAGDGAAFYTVPSLGLAHAEPTRPAHTGWNPVLGATFDTGVVAVTGSRIALLWFADED